VFGSSQGLSWSDSHRRHIQLVADLTAVAIESEWLQEDSRRHERLDRQLSTGAEIQAQLLPNDCPVIEGIELAAHCRPAFQVGGDYYDFIPTHPQHFGRQRETSPWALVMGDVMGKGCAGRPADDPVARHAAGRGAQRSAARSHPPRPQRAGPGDLPIRIGS